MLVLAVLLTGQTWAESPIWQPENTWVFAVGVLQFDSKGLQTYPEEGRVDAVMIEALKKRGVPAENIVFIKNEQATKTHIVNELVKLLKRATSGDMLLFYYTGHGGRDYSDPSRPVNFITYDTASVWTVREMLDCLEANFSGARALLIADCCHSGGLAEEAARRTSSKIGYGVLASAQPASVSTSNWTFTQCMADLFNGHAALDLDRNGHIEFREAGQYSDAEMCFCEDQRACHAALGTFSESLVLARTNDHQPSWLGQHCEAPSNGIWLKGKVVDSKDGMYLVDWVDRPKKRDTWLSPEQLRKHTPPALEAGQNVRIEWNGGWYKGQILRVQGGLHFVHYEGFPVADDEWVPLRRLRPQP
jgi:hypothetical protein